MREEKRSDQAMYDFYGKMPLKRAIPLGLQHVLAMFVGNLTPLLIICGACGISGSEEFAQLQVSLLQNAMFVAGVVTLVQLYAIGPIGGKVPIIMGTSSGFIGVFKSVADTMGGGLATYGAIMGASVIGGLFEGVLGFFIRPLRKFFPAVVTGTVVLSIGLSLISVGINSFGGGNGAKDFGSMENLLLALFVLVVILIVKHWTKGIASNSAILIGIIAGYGAAVIMSLILPTTGITADGTEYTKAWVLNWDKVAQASWISIPEILPVKPVFDVRAIAPIMIMFIVTAVETVGDISGVIEGGMNREATDKELSGGVICDGIGSSFAALFGILPNTSFSQNVGLVTMTKVVNRTALATGAVFLILCGLVPKLGAIVSIMPQAVLGGAAVMMFSSIVISGIQLITKEKMTAKNLTIVSVALGVGYGMGANTAILAQTPQAIQLIFGGSGIVPAAVVAILLNIVLPDEKK
ncbi:MAG: purine permease [Clostridium sp.]|nr:purine permease [Clostridium sp.]